MFRLRDMLFAQGLGEYGSLSGGGSGGVSSVLSDIVAAIEDAIRNPTPKTWVAVGAFCFVMWFVFIRRRR